MLLLETFKTAIESSPLVSIDLIVGNSEGQILLGKHTNRPAKGYWFVPVQRILKDKFFECVFKRLIAAELNLT
jgi:colanic acid biosynthesis protein WcaH